MIEDRFYPGMALSCCIACGRDSHEVALVSDPRSLMTYHQAAFCNDERDFRRHIRECGNEHIHLLTHAFGSRRCSGHGVVDDEIVLNDVA